MPLGQGALEAFQVGQGLGQGQSTLGHMVRQVVERYSKMQELQGEAQLGLQKEQALIPLREASASRLLQEKARLFPPQPKNLSGETAGRLSLATSGAGHATTAKRLLFPTGDPASFDRGLVVAMKSPFGVGMIGNGKAQSLEFNLMRAIDSQLRSETGATAPPEELKRLSREFIANAVADPQAAYERLQALEGGLQQTSNFIDPSGHYRKIGNSPFDSQNRDEDLSSMSDEDILRGAGLTQ